MVGVVVSVAQVFDIRSYPTGPVKDLDLNHGTCVVREWEASKPPTQLRERERERARVREREPLLVHQLH